MGVTGPPPPGSPAGPGWNGTPNADGSYNAPPAGAATNQLDGVDLPPEGEAVKKQAAQNADESWKMNLLFLQIQHEQAMQKLVVEAATAIQKNAQDVGEFIVNKI